MIFFVASLACARGQYVNDIHGVVAKKVIGRASWYGPHFFLHTKSNHKRYIPTGVFVASLSYPLGTKLQITNLRNNRTVVAPVEDRGPYVKGRSLDLSYEAAKEIGMINDGVVPVSYKEVK